MKRIKPTNITGRPSYEGQYALAVAATGELDLKKSIRNEHGDLAWQDIISPSHLQATLTLLRRMEDSPLPSTHVRNETLRQYAVNLMFKQFPVAIKHPAYGSDFFQRIASLCEETLYGRLPSYASKNGMACAVAAGFEILPQHTSPGERLLAIGELVIIEHMLAIAERTPDDSPERITYGALSALKDLRRGVSPSGSMFTTDEQLIALAQQFPALAQALPGPGNNSAQPTYEGQHRFSRVRQHLEAERLEVAEKTDLGALNWVTVNAPLKIEAASKAFHAIKDGIADPYIRTSVVRQYAVNLMLRHFDDIGGDPQRLDNLARGIEVTLQNNQGLKAIPFAIEQGLEIDQPYLAEIEAMLAQGSAMAIGIGGTATMSITRSALGVLEDLRNGGNPSAGMLTTHEALVALQQHYPIFKRVDLSQSDAPTPSIYESEAPSFRDQP